MAFFDRHTLDWWLASRAGPPVPQPRTGPMAPASPPQPRHPRLTALLEANRARLRVKARRAARLLLREAGLNVGVM